MSDVAPESRPNPPKASPTPGPNEAELSRIARQAVHQAPDARLDKQLARMGVLDTTEPVEPQSGRSSGGSDAIGPELERLREELRRTKVILWVLVAVIAILAVVVVVLLFR
jgi:hypothetical protein